MWLSINVKKSRSVEVAKCLTIVFKRIQNSTLFFKEDGASYVRVTGKRGTLKLKYLPEWMTILDYRHGPPLVQYLRGKKANVRGVKGK
jgi:hypothetical protein